MYISFLALMEILALLFPMLLKDINELATGNDTTTAQLIFNGLIVFGIVVLIFVVNLTGEFFGAKALSGFQKNLRDEMFEKVQAAPVERINELGTGSVLPIIMNDTAWIRNLQRHLMIFVVFFPVAILGSIIMLFSLELYYGLFALASLPIVLIFFFVNSRQLGKIMQKSIPGFDATHVQVKEGIIGAKEIRIFNKAEEREKEFEESFWYNRQQNSQTLKSINLSVSFNAVLFTLITVAIIIYGAYTMTDVSQLVALNVAILYVNRLWSGSHEIFKLFVEYIPRIKLAKQRIARIYNLPIESHEGGLKPDLTGIAGVSLEMKGVSYKYPNGVSGLGNININVEKNTLVAITGGAGSGRTVIPHLLLQYAKPATGKITIDGTDIYNLHASYYRRYLIAFCDQTPEFIPGTIRDNLTLLNPEATDEEILKLFKEIGAESFTKKFDNFLDHTISERHGFNMATKKLLNLARSLLKPAPIYIFNQCFDHVNIEYVAKICAKLKREQKTCIFITQSNIVTQHSDKIYVMKNGMISNTGVHADLIKNSADYRELSLASAGRIINEEVAKEIEMIPEDTTLGGDAL